MKKYFLALLMLVSQAVTAQTPGDDIRKVAYNQAVAAITLAENRVRTCEAKKSRKIPKELIPKLELTDKEWNLAFFILSMRADDFCSGDADGRALMYFMRYQIVEEQFTQKTIDQIVMPNKNVVTIHALIGSDPVKYIETEIKYLAIDAAAREKLESLNFLKHPFRIPFKAIEADANK